MVRKEQAIQVIQTYFENGMAKGNQFVAHKIINASLILAA